MAVYRYVGGNTASVWNTKYEFNSYGQLVELPDDMAATCIEQGVHLIPPEEFDIIHTPDDLKKYSKYQSHANAPADFIERRNTAWGAAQAYRASRVVKVTEPVTDQLVTKDKE